MSYLQNESCSSSPLQNILKVNPCVQAFNIQEKEQEWSYGCSNSLDKKLRQKLNYLSNVKPQSKFAGINFQKCSIFDEEVIDPIQMIKSSYSDLKYKQIINGILQVLIIFLNCEYARGQGQIFCTIAFVIGCISQWMLYTIHMSKFCILKINELQQIRINISNSPKRKNKENSQELKTSQMKDNKKYLSRNSVIYNTKQLNQSNRKSLINLQRSFLLNNNSFELQSKQNNSITKQNISPKTQNTSINNRRSTLLSSNFQLKKVSDKRNSNSQSPIIVYNNEMSQIILKKDPKGRKPSCDNEIKTTNFTRGSLNESPAFSKIQFEKCNQSKKKPKKGLYYSDEMRALKKINMFTLLKQFNYQWLQYLINCVSLITLGIKEEIILRNLLLLQLLRSIFIIDAFISYQKVELTHQYSLFAKLNLHINPLQFVTFTLCFIIILFSCVYSVIEQSEYLWDSIWNIIVSITTIGYGDIIPITSSGRILIIVCSNILVIFLSFIASLIQSSQQFNSTEQEQFDKIFIQILKEQKIYNEAAFVIQYYLRKIIQKYKNQFNNILNYQNNQVFLNKNKIQDEKSNKKKITKPNKKLFDKKEFLNSVLLKQERKNKCIQKIRKFYVSHQLDQHQFLKMLESKNITVNQILQSRQNTYFQKYPFPNYERRGSEIKLDFNINSSIPHKISMKSDTFSIQSGIFSTDGKLSFKTFRSFCQETHVTDIDQELDFLQKNFQEFMNQQFNISKTLKDIQALIGHSTPNTKEISQFDDQFYENNNKNILSIIQETLKETPQQSNLSNTCLKTMTFQAATQRSINTIETPVQNGRIPEPFNLKSCCSHEDNSNSNKIKIFSIRDLQSNKTLQSNKELQSNIEIQTNNEFQANNEVQTNNELKTNNELLTNNEQKSEIDEQIDQLNIRKIPQPFLNLMQQNKITQLDEDFQNNYLLKNYKIPFFFNQQSHRYKSKYEKECQFLNKLVQSNKDQIINKSKQNENILNKHLASPKQDKVYSKEHQKEIIENQNTPNSLNPILNSFIDDCSIQKKHCLTEKKMKIYHRQKTDGYYQYDEALNLKNNLDDESTVKKTNRPRLNLDSQFDTNNF